ncbi:MAG: hypothetical protein JEY97_09575 [Bacteroidales bacterium]|nr:hypothetical protein [Bacteroidales bacterium]
MSKQNPTQNEKLEEARIAIENSQSHPEIAELLTENGYDAAKINEGELIYIETRRLFDFKVTEVDETKESKTIRDNKLDALHEIYKKHRSKAKVAFRKDPVILNQLEIHGRIPTKYIKYIEIVRKFYSVLLADEILQQRLLYLKITPEVLSQANSQLSEVEQAQADYIRETGETQSSRRLTII